MNKINSLIQFSFPYTFIVGSYERNRNNDHLCNILGFELAKHNIGIISAGSKPGLQILYSMDKALSDLNQYEPTKLLTFFRKNGKPLSSELRRIGCNIFIGKNIDEMRNAIFSKASLLIVIGGGSKTKEEILLAEKRSIPVIPIGMSGGAANRTWMEYEISNQLGHHDSFIELNNKNYFVAARATAEIVKSVYTLKH